MPMTVARHATRVPPALARQRNARAAVQRNGGVPRSRQRPDQQLHPARDARGGHSPILAATFGWRSARTAASSSTRRSTRGSPSTPAATRRRRVSRRRFPRSTSGWRASLVDRHGLHGKDLIEIGCGKGEFLKLLCDLGRQPGPRLRSRLLGGPRRGSRCIAFPRGPGLLLGAAHVAQGGLSSPAR